MPNPVESRHQAQARAIAAALFKVPYSKFENEAYHLVSAALSEAHAQGLEAQQNARVALEAHKLTLRAADRIEQSHA